MIVKIAHPKSKDSFVRLSGYIMQEIKIASHERMDSISQLTNYMAREGFVPTATNCGVDPTDIDAALKVIEHTQSQNQRAKKKSLHLIVSFPEGERPSEPVIADIEKELVGALGMEECQRIRVVHDDTDYLHMHIAVNVIHPRMHISIQPSRDYILLSEKAHELEVKHGLSHCTEREHRLQGRSRRYLDSLDPANVYRGEESFKSWVMKRRTEIHAMAERSEDWSDFQLELGSLGMEAIRYRNGLVFRNLHGRGFIKGSEVNRELSKPSLEKRWGDMPRGPRSRHPMQRETENETIGVRTGSRRSTVDHADIVRYRRQPVFIQDAALYEEYLKEKEEAFEENQEASRVQRARASRQYKGLRDRFKNRAQRIRRSPFLDGGQKRRAFERLGRERRKAYQRLSGGSAPTVNFLSSMGYRSWLIRRAKNGDERALNEVRGLSRRLNEKKPWTSLVQGDLTSEERIRDAAESKGKRIHRDGTVEITAGNVTLLDDGDRLHALGNDLDDIRLLLEAGKVRYRSPLEIHGSQGFRDSALMVAVEMDGIEFRDREMQRTLERMRREGRSLENTQSDRSI